MPRRRRLYAKTAEVICHFSLQLTNELRPKWSKKIFAKMPFLGRTLDRGPTKTYVPSILPGFVWSEAFVTFCLLVRTGNQASLEEFTANLQL